ncbi:hypothetical protein ABPG73_004650 [Tetrahymena malaccensis]
MNFLKENAVGGDDTMICLESQSRHQSKVFNMNPCVSCMIDSFPLGTQPTYHTQTVSPPTFNNQSLENIDLFFANLAKCEKIQSLDFKLTSMNHQQLIALFSGISTLKNLRSLKLSFMINQLKQNEEYLELGTQFRKIANLNSLKFKLQYNQINDAQAIEIVNGLSHLTNLTYLYIGLWQNIIGNEGAVAIGNLLCSLKNLTNLRLCLGGNSIQDLGAVSISKGISELKNLANLKFFLWQT